MNLLEIIVIVVVALLAVGGFRMGFVKKLASMVSLLLSLVLVSLLLPYMTDYLKNNTPVYDFIVKQCEDTVRNYAAESLPQGSQGTGGGQLDTYREMGREQIADLMEQYGYDSSVLDTLDDAELERYKEEYIQKYIDEFLGGEEGTTDEPVTIGRIEQTEIIENLPLPQILKDMLLDYNNEEGYERLNVSSFQDYVISFIASAILNVVSFIAAVIVVQLVLWVLIGALNILANIPVIRIVNRFAGLGLGVLHALFLLWIFFLVLSMLSATDAGMYLMSMVQESRWLSQIYDVNLFPNIVLRAAALLG